MNTRDFEGMTIDASFQAVKSAPEGLPQAEALARLAQVGSNEIAQKKERPVREFLLRFWGPMPWLLELAMVLSAVLGHDIEGAMILVLLVINAIIGQVHSRNSQRAVQMLKSRLAVQAKVLRDGAWAPREAREIVPGDVIMLRMGDVVPADAKIINGEISVDQSALTGESLPVDQAAGGVIYSGCAIKRGEARCLTVNTGASTFFGKTAELVKIAKPRSHQEEVMIQVVRSMMYLGIGATILVAAYAAVLHVGFLVIMTFAVIFLMGAVPVALPAVLTIVQAVGALQLSRRGALVTRLDSVEDAASIDSLCLDKTGTITENKLQVTEVVPLGSISQDEVLRLAALASREDTLDVIDLAVLARARALGPSQDGNRIVSFTPFDTSTKRTEATVEGTGGTFRVIKGAPQIVMGLCKDGDGALEDAAHHAVEEASRKGYRTIAVARSAPVLAQPALCGFISLSDPPRPDSARMIDEMKALGIKPYMLTGDNEAIARQVSQAVGIGPRIMRIAELNAVEGKEQLSLLRESDGLAEIYPEDKYRVVKLLQSNGAMVGMTGDGVNDAPALKQAEMGIAVNNATDVAKASASMVLTEPGVTVIVEAIKISRQTYQRMLTWVINKMTKVIGFVGLLTISFVWLHAIPITLLGMALLVFANDFATMALSTDNVTTTTNPNSWKVRDIVLACLLPSLLFVAEGIGAIALARAFFQLTWSELQTVVLLNLIFASQFRVLIVRDRRHFWSSRPGRGLVLSVIGTLLLFSALGALGILVAPIGLFQVALVLGYSAVTTLAIDFPKRWSFRRYSL